MHEAWDLWDKVCADDRVEFLPEPEAIPSGIRVRKSCRQGLWIRLQAYRNRYWLGQALARSHLSYSGQLFCFAGFPHDDQLQPEMERCMTTRRQSPVLPAIIVVLLLAP